MPKGQFNQMAALANLGSVVLKAVGKAGLKAQKPVPQKKRKTKKAKGEKLAAVSDEAAE